MTNLLSKTENRRLKLIEILSNTHTRINLETLSKQLDCSVRVVREDLIFLREQFNEFELHTVKDEIQLIYRPSKGIKHIYQHFYNHSTSYQLMEIAFFEEGDSIEELEERLFVSTSTIYRLMKQLNKVLSTYDFKVVLNPIQITGNEQNIRTYFYDYFYEKYLFTSWPFKTLNEEELNVFLEFHINMTQMKNDFAYFNKFKIIGAVNLLRFKQKHWVNTDGIEMKFQDRLPDLKSFSSIFERFERAFDIEYDDNAIKQIFTAYIQSDFSMDYAHLMKRASNDEEIANEVSLIANSLEKISKENKIEIPNKEQMISAIRNIIHLDYLEPNPGYILYNHDKYFMESLKKEFPDFYSLVYPIVKNLREELGKPQTEAGINFYIYTIFTYWENLVSYLQAKLQKIRVIVISDRQANHAKLIKDFINHRFSAQIEVDVYSEQLMTKHDLESLDCDLIVANFILPESINTRTVYIRNFPFYSDLRMLSKLIDQIKEERLNESEVEFG